MKKDESYRNAENLMSKEHIDELIKDGYKVVTINYTDKEATTTYNPDQDQKKRGEI